jgi:hypothetical protein
MIKTKVVTKIKCEPELVAYAYNPSYSGDRSGGLWFKASPEK